MMRVGPQHDGDLAGCAVGARFPGRYVLWQRKIRKTKKSKKPILGRPAPAQNRANEPAKTRRRADARLPVARPGSRLPGPQPVLRTPMAVNLPAAPTARPRDAPIRQRERRMPGPPRRRRPRASARAARRRTRNRPGQSSPSGGRRQVRGRQTRARTGRATLRLPVAARADQADPAAQAGTPVATTSSAREAAGSRAGIRRFAITAAPALRATRPAAGPARRPITRDRGPAVTPAGAPGLRARPAAARRTQRWPSRRAGQPIRQPPSPRPPVRRPDRP